jgi:CubicO group peptidase (beta-lactamase class C family)
VIAGGKLQLLAAWFAIFVGLSSGCGYPPPELPAADSGREETGELSWPRRVAIDGVLKFRVLSGARSGYVALVARDGRLVHGYTEGYADIDSESPMTMGTRFRIASMTKPVTAVAAMMLVEEGRLSLDDPVSRYLPSVADMRVVADAAADELALVPQSPPMLVRHLLSFASGVGGYARGEETTLARQYRDKGLYGTSGSLAERVDRVTSLPLYEQPGTRWRYGWSLDLMARIVEVASGESFDAFLRTRIFLPLGMTNTFYPMNLPEGVPLATLYERTADGELATSHSSFHASNWTPGGSGLVSTAPDYMRFALMLWNRGSYDGVRILQPETVDEMTRLHVRSGVLEEFGMAGLGFGLGVSVVADEDATSMISRDGDYWWSGAHGTHFWVSPVTGVVVVVLQQMRRNAHSGLPVAPYIVQGLAMF